MFEPKLIITPEIHQLTADIDVFKGKWDALKQLAPERLTLLRKIATIESVASSTRIEGVTLTNAEVERLLDNLSIQHFATRDEQEVAGYAEVMDVVFNNHADIQLTENTIKHLHSILLKYSAKDTRHKGEYKKLSNNVAAFNEQGQQIAIIFETATPFETPYKMEALIQWTNKALTEKQYHALLIIGIFIVVFLAIHPFQDGNGRLSRILTTLLLLHSGYLYVPYASMEKIIEENKEYYYKALRRTQKSLESETPNWDSWLIFFLNTLKKQTNHLEKRIEAERLLSNRLSVFSTDILSLFDTHAQLTISDITQLTKANKNTVKVHLRDLVNNGLLIKHGQARATWYSRK